MNVYGKAKASEPASRAARPVARIVGTCAVRLWGLSAAERLRRSLHRAGVAECGPEGEPLPRSGHVVLVRADHVFEDRLIRDLVAKPDTVLAIDGGGASGATAPIAVAAHVDAARAGPVVATLRRGRLDPGDPALAGLAVLGPGEVAPAYDQALRKRGPPYVLSLSDRPVSEIERRMFHGAYKGVTDFVTKWLWPAPALAVTRWAAGRGITPNLVTAVSLVLVFLALGLFAAGHFVVGLAAAWIMTFLDTVDGKLARVTLTATPAGNAFDHGIDLVHPPFWYAAWWYGLSGSAIDGWVAGYVGPALWPALWVVLGGYLVGRLMEGLFLWLFRIEIHAWRPIDSAFRLFTARRNPNLTLLTAGTVAGRPDIGFLAVAIWTAVSLLFHGLRIGQALHRRRRGAPIRSWLVEARLSEARLSEVGASRSA